MGCKNSFLPSNSAMDIVDTEKQNRNIKFSQNEVPKERSPGTIESHDDNDE